MLKETEKLSFIKKFQKLHKIKFFQNCWTRISFCSEGEFLSGRKKNYFSDAFALIASLIRLELIKAGLRFS